MKNWHFDTNWSARELFPGVKRTGRVFFVFNSTFVCVAEKAAFHPEVLEGRRGWCSYNLLHCMHALHCLREGLLRKICCSFGFRPNNLSPPPILENLYNFFSDVEIQDLVVSLGLKILYFLSIYSLKFKLLEFRRI